VFLKPAETLTFLEEIFDWTGGHILDTLGQLQTENKKSPSKLGCREGLFEYQIFARRGTL
jgi:hypothetical protein